MAFFETPGYLIDTDDFETEKDVMDMINNISDEKFSLCRRCPKSRRCYDNDEEYPADDPNCIRHEECRALDTVMEALLPYAAVLAGKSVA
jgi:hypothetical protein